MRKNLERFRVLIFGLSMLMSFCSAYLQYDSLGKIHFLSSNPALENFVNVDREDLVMDPPDRLKGMVPVSFLNLSHPGIQAFKDSFSFPFQPFPFEQKTSILRR